MIRPRDGMGEDQSVEGFVRQPPEAIICWAESDDDRHKPVRRTLREPMLFLGLVGVVLVAVVGVATSYHDLRARIESRSSVLLGASGHLDNCARLPEVRQIHREMVSSRFPQGIINPLDCSLMTDGTN